MKRLLVVDDVPLFRAGLSSALRDAGFEIVAEAGGAEAAVTAAEEYQPDLVLLDILMPGVSGLEVVEKITAVAPGAKVVLLTASESEEDLLVGVKAGARGYARRRRRRWRSRLAEHGGQAARCNPAAAPPPGASPVEEARAHRA